jgi:CubicO group peptidase (beta-lactamase class C family)
MSRTDQIARVAQSYIDGHKFSGIEWHVEAKGRVLDQGQCGHADAEAKSAIPAGALYRIFSMTKPIVSLLALQLIEQGRLRLYDMVAQYDRRFERMMVLTSDGAIMPAARPITVEDLLTHRAGFTYEFLHGCHIAQYYREAEISADGYATLDEMMDRLAPLPLAFQPGSKWRYSVSIDVLANVIEKATGERLSSLLDEYIFEPLGMQDTAFSVPEDKRHRIMPMYGQGLVDGLPPLQPSPQELVRFDAEPMNPSDRPGSFQRGGLGLFSTLADYAAFARMLLTGKSPQGDVVVSRKMLEMLRCNRIDAAQMPLAIGPNVFAGYGWGLIGRVRLDDGQANSLSGGGEFGWAGAATTYFWVDPVEDMFGVVMTQYLGAMLPLSDDMRTAAYQALT